MVGGARHPTLTQKQVRGITNWLTDIKAPLPWVSPGVDTYPMGHHAPAQVAYKEAHTWLRLKPIQEPMALWIARPSQTTAKWLRETLLTHPMRINSTLRKILTSTLNTVHAVWKRRSTTNKMLKDKYPDPAPPARTQSPLPVIDLTIQRPPAPEVPAEWQTVRGGYHTPRFLPKQGTLTRNFFKPISQEDNEADSES